MRSLYAVGLAFFLFCVGFAPATASESARLVVKINGIDSAEGDVTCALFADETGFPMEAPPNRGQSHPADPAGVECIFEGLDAGTYAVAASHDRNGNGKTDTRMFGIPKEPWGVTNGVRPKMRPPRFEEAAFEIAAGEQRTLEVEVKQ